MGFRFEVRSEDEVVVLEVDQRTVHVCGLSYVVDGSSSGSSYEGGEGCCPVGLRRYEGRVT